MSVGGVVWISLVSLLCGNAAYWLAIGKGRDDAAKRWTVLATLLPISLPFLCLRRRKESEDARKRWFIVPLVVLANLVLLMPIAAIIALGLYEGLGLNIPACDSAAASNAVRSVNLNSQIGKSTGLKILSLVDVQEISRTRKQVQCRSKAVLNNGSSAEVSYAATTVNDSGQWILTVRLDEVHAK